MKLREALRRIGRYVEAFDYSLDYNPVAEIAARLERLERRVADLNARTPA